MAKTEHELIKLVELAIKHFNHDNRTAQRNGLTSDEYWNETI
ncbi:hypothetical protein [Loigolactobacillus zhaoyuanensis]|nr:hypothetical protein [Loigolactobacillus zhaoyuanensis]